MSDNIFSLMVADVRNTAVKDSGVPLRMTLGEAQKSYLPTRRTLCYQRQKEWGISQKYCFRQKREETRGRLAEGVSCKALIEAGYGTSKEWRRSMKNLKKLETWTPQDGEGSVWLELMFGTNPGTEFTHGMLGKMDERIREMKGREIES